MNVPIMLAVSWMILSFSFGILFVYALANVSGIKGSKKDHDTTIRLLTEANEHRNEINVNIANIAYVLNRFLILADNFIKDEKAKHPPIDVMK